TLVRADLLRSLYWKLTVPAASVWEVRPLGTRLASGMRKGTQHGRGPGANSLQVLVSLWSHSQHIGDCHRPRLHAPAHLAIPLAAGDSSREPGRVSDPPAQIPDGNGTRQGVGDGLAQA